MRSKYIEAPEVEALKKHLSKNEWMPLWLSLETGLRIGDCVSLRVSDVKPDGVHFRAQKTGKRGVARISAKLRTELPREGK